MKVNPNAPLYYVKSGRPVDLITTEPVVQYRVRYSNGCEAVLSAEELDSQMTNEQPLFKFMSSFATGHLIVKGEERHVQFGIRRKFGDFPGQSLCADDVDALYRQLGQWLDDRRKTAQAHSADSYDPRANGAR